jgi:hypothetical protein
MLNALQSKSSYSMPMLATQLILVGESLNDVLFDGGIVLWKS